MTKLEFKRRLNIFWTHSVCSCCFLNPHPLSASFFPSFSSSLHPEVRVNCVKEEKGGKKQQQRTELCCPVWITQFMKPPLACSLVSGDISWLKECNSEVMLQGTGVVLCFHFGPIIMIRNKATLAMHNTCTGLDVNIRSINKVHSRHSLFPTSVFEPFVTFSRSSGSQSTRTLFLFATPILL